MKIETNNLDILMKNVEVLLLISVQAILIHAIILHVTIAYLMTT